MGSYLTTPHPHARTGSPVHCATSSRSDWAALSRPYDRETPARAAETLSDALRRGRYGDVPLVPKATSYDAVVILIMQFPVVMVEEGLNKIVGIITGADLVGR